MWDRLASASCAAFFDEVLDEVQARCNEMAAAHPYREGQELVYILNNKYGLEIEDVYLQDGTYWRLQESMADQYPGTRSNVAATLVEDTFDEDGAPIYEKKKVAGIGFQTQIHEDRHHKMHDSHAGNRQRKGVCSGARRQ